MDRQLRTMLIQTQAHVAANMLRTIGAVARGIGETIERSLEGFANGILGVTANWAMADQIREAQMNQVAGLGESSWRSLVGEPAWEAFRNACAKMRASTGKTKRSTPTKEELEDLFLAIFSSMKGRENAEAEAAKPEAPTAQ